MKNISCIVVLFVCTIVQGQDYFQKIYKLNDSVSFFSDVYLHDSTYWLGSTVGAGNSHLYTDLVRINSTGDVLSSFRNVTIPAAQFYAFSKTDMDTNFRGNLVLGYVSTIHPANSIGKPRITEFDFQGNVVFDIEIQDFVYDSIYFFTNGSLVCHNQDSSYYLAFSYNDIDTDLPDVGFQGEAGVMLFKVGYDGSLIWRKPFRHEPTGAWKPTWFMGDLKPINDSVFSLFLQETFQYGGSGAEQSWGKVHFITLDLDGNEIKHTIFQDTQNDEPGLSVLPLADGGMLYAYAESQITGTPPNSDYYEHRHVITRLNNLGQAIWKDTLNNFWGNYSYYNLPNRFLQWTDSSVLYAFEYLFDMPSNEEYIVMRIENRHLNGEVLWYRDYNYYPITFNNDPEYQILDLAQTPSGDLLFTGHVINYDLLSQNLSGQNAYLLKTNCLGFMGDPQAAFYIHDLGSNQVKLVNTSLQAGTFSWDLGDGTLIENDERTDTIYHTYPDNNMYPVRLIAKGCPGKADTLDLIWNWVGLEEETANTYFQINPNPVNSGELLSIYVGVLPEANCRIQISNQNGQVVNSYPISQSNTTYAFEMKQAAGVYFVNLMNGEWVLQQEKLVLVE